MPTSSGLSGGGRRLSTSPLAGAGGGVRRPSLLSSPSLSLPSSSVNSPSSRRGGGGGGELGARDAVGPRRVSMAADLLAAQPLATGASHSSILSHSPVQKGRMSSAARKSLAQLSALDILVGGSGAVRPDDAVAFDDEVDGDEPIEASTPRAASFLEAPSGPAGSSPSSAAGRGDGDYGDDDSECSRSSSSTVEDRGDATDVGVGISHAGGGTRSASRRSLSPVASAHPTLEGDRHSVSSRVGTANSKGYRRSLASSARLGSAAPSNAADGEASTTAEVIIPPIAIAVDGCDDIFDNREVGDEGEERGASKLDPQVALHPVDDAPTTVAPSAYLFPQPLPLQPRFSFRLAPKKRREQGGSSDAARGARKGSPRGGEEASDGSDEGLADPPQQPLLAVNSPFGNFQQMTRMIEVVEAVAPKLQLQGTHQRGESDADDGELTSRGTNSASVALVMEIPSSLSPRGPEQPIVSLVGIHGRCGDGRQVGAAAVSSGGAAVAYYAEPAPPPRAVVVSRAALRRAQADSIQSMLAYEHASLRKAECEGLRGAILDHVLGRAPLPSLAAQEALRVEGGAVLGEGCADGRPPMANQGDDGHGSQIIGAGPPPVEHHPSPGDGDASVLSSPHSDHDPHPDGGGQQGNGAVGSGSDGRARMDSSSRPDVNEALSRWIAGTFMAPSFGLDAQRMGLDSTHYRRLPLVPLGVAVGRRGNRCATSALSSSPIGEPAEGDGEGTAVPILMGGGVGTQLGCGDDEGAPRRELGPLLAAPGQTGSGLSSREGNEADGRTPIRRGAPLPYKGFIARRRERMRLRMAEDTQGASPSSASPGAESIEEGVDADDGAPLSSRKEAEAAEALKAHRVTLALKKNPYVVERKSPFMEYAIGADPSTMGNTTRGRR